MKKLLIPLVVVMLLAIGVVYFIRENGKECDLEAAAHSVNVCAPGFACTSNMAQPQPSGRCELVKNFLELL